MHTDLENHMVLGDPDEPHHCAGSIEMDCPESQDEVLTLLRERMLHNDWDAIWDDVLIQCVPGSERTYSQWLDSIFDRVRNDDLLKLGEQTHELRQSMRETFIRCVDLRRYNIHWETEE